MARPLAKKYVLKYPQDLPSGDLEIFKAFFQWYKREKKLVKLTYEMFSTWALGPDWDGFKGGYLHFQKIQEERLHFQKWAESQKPLTQ